MQVKHQPKGQTFEKMHNALQLRLRTLFPPDTYDFDFVSLMYTTHRTDHAIPLNSICFDIWGIDSFVQPLGSLNVLDEKTYFC